MGDSSHGRMSRSMVTATPPRKNNSEEVARRRTELLQEQEQIREQQKARRDERAARAADQKNQILARQRDNIRRELTRSKQVLDRKAQLQVEEKEKRAAVLSKAHANASRLAQNKSKPMFAFGSSTPRELGYLTQLTKEQKVYDRKLQPSPPPPSDSSQTATPQRRAAPHGHSPATSRDMTTSLYTTRLRASLAPNTMTQSMVNPQSKMAPPHLSAASAARANRPRLAPNSAASRATPLRMKESIPSTGDRPTTTHKTVGTPRRVVTAPHHHSTSALHTNRKVGPGVVAEQKKTGPEAVGLEGKKIARRVISVEEGVHHSQIAENAQVNSDSPLKPLHQDSEDTQQSKETEKHKEMPEAHKQQDELLVVVKEEAEQKRSIEDMTLKSAATTMDVIKESSVENDADEQTVNKWSGVEEVKLDQNEMKLTDDDDEQTMVEDSTLVDALLDTSNVQTADPLHETVLGAMSDKKAENGNIEEHISTVENQTEKLSAVTEKQQLSDVKTVLEGLPTDVENELSEVRILTEDLFVVEEAHSDNTDKLSSTTEQFSEVHEATVLREQDQQVHHSTIEKTEPESKELTPRSPPPSMVTSEFEHKKTLEVAHYEPKMDEENNKREGDAQEASVSATEHVVSEPPQGIDRTEEKTEVVEIKPEDDVKKTLLDEAQQQRQALLKQRAEQEQKEREERKARLAAIMRGRTRAGAPTAVVAPTTQSSLITDESGVAEPLKDVERPAPGADATAPHVFSQTTASILQKLASSKPRLMSVLQRNGSNPSLADELTAADPMMNLPGQPDAPPTTEKQPLSQTSPPPSTKSPTPLKSQDFKTSLAMN